MRLLFSGDLSPTGFGSVTMDLGRELLKVGDDVRFISQNFLPDLKEPFRSRTVNLRTFSVGPDVRDGHIGVTGLVDAFAGLLDGTAPVLMGDGSAYGDWSPDAVLFLGDYGALRMTLNSLKGKTKVPTFHYVPIEGVGLAPGLRETWEIAKPIACSVFGADQIARVTGERPAMAYHGVDTTMFRPISNQAPMFLRDERTRATVALTTKAEAKQAWGRFIAEANGLTNLPKKWLLRTDRHMPRKRYNSLIRSLLPVLDRHPDWGLVMHCHTQDDGGNLELQLTKIPERMRRQFLLTHAAGIDRDLLRGLYCASDLYVSNSAEGFGLTIAEAIACGVPAVGVGYSAVPEVIGPAGVIVSEGGLVDDQYDAYWWAADEQAFGSAVENLMTHDTRREQLGRLGPAHIKSTFRWEASAKIIREAIAGPVVAEVAA